MGPPAVGRGFFCRGRWWLLGLLLVGAAGVAALVAVRGRAQTCALWGFPAGDVAFLDMQVVTAGAESRALGFDPLLENPADPALRPMNYPRVWQWLAYLSVTGADTAPLAGAAIAGYLVAVWAFAWRPGRGSALLLAVAVFSPAGLLCVERGNTDLVLFALAAAALGLLRRNAAAATGLLLGGFVLKLYPILGFAALLREKRRELLALGALTAAVVVVHLWLLHDEIRAIRAATPSGTAFSYGAASFAGLLSHLAGALSPGGRAMLWGGVALVVLSGLGWAVRPLGRGGRATAVERVPDPDLDAFRLGAAIYLGTYLLGGNFDYRMVFLLFTIPQLWSWRAGAGRRPGRCATVMLAAALLALWQPVWEHGFARLGLLPAGALGGQVIKALLAVLALRLLVATLPGWLLAGGPRPWRRATDSPAPSA